MNRDLKIILGLLTAVFAISLYALGRDAVEHFVRYAAIVSTALFFTWLLLQPVKIVLKYIHEKLKKYEITGLYFVIALAFLMTGAADMLIIVSKAAYPHRSHEELIRLHTQP